MSSAQPCTCTPSTDRASADLPPRLYTSRTPTHVMAGRPAKRAAAGQHTARAVLIAVHHLSTSRQRRTNPSWVFSRGGRRANALGLSGRQAHERAPAGEPSRESARAAGRCTETRARPRSSATDARARGGAVARASARRAGSARGRSAAT